MSCPEYPSISMPAHLTLFLNPLSTTPDNSKNVGRTAWESNALEIASVLAVMLAAVVPTATATTTTSTPRTTVLRTPSLLLTTVHAHRVVVVAAPLPRSDRICTTTTSIATTGLPRPWCFSSWHWFWPAHSCTSATRPGRTVTRPSRRRSTRRMATGHTLSRMFEACRASIEASERSTHSC